MDVSQRQFWAHLEKADIDRTAQDFLGRGTICGLCRRLLKQWPGWAQHNHWGKNYPGDLCLPSRFGFVRSSLLGEKGCHSYQTHPRRTFGDHDLMIYPFRRPIAWIQYKDCRVCFLIYFTLKLENFRSGFVDLGIFPVSRDLVRIYVRTKTTRENEISGSLQLYQSTRAHEIVTNEFLPTSTGSRQSIERLRDRLEACCLSQCATTAEWAPLRLIELRGTTYLCPSVRLIHSHDLSSPPPYLTLSHRWSKQDRLLLQADNLNNFQRGIEWSTIPKTFSDAMILTLELGYSYIWIDSLCIIQDSRSDWNVQATQMCQVYSNTVLNLYADCAPDSDNGIFRHHDPWHSTSFPIYVDWPGMTNYVWYCGPSDPDMFETHHSSLNTYLESRGWVWQEELLSPAIAYFGHHDIYWICRHQVAREDSQLCQDVKLMDTDYFSLKPLGNLLSIKKFLDGTHFWKNESSTCSAIQLAISAWNKVVERYAACKLTIESDKFIALAGLAQRFCDRAGLANDEFVAGHWRRLLIESICWTVKATSKTQSPVMKHGKYVAPTWSWASVNGTVTPDLLLITHQRNLHVLLGQIISVKVSTQNGAFGLVVGGHLDIAAYLIKFRMVSDMVQQGKRNAALLMMPCGHLTLVGLDTFISPDFTLSSQSDGNVVYLYFLVRHMSASGVFAEFQSPHRRLYVEGLLLRKENKARGEYARVGVAQTALSELLHEPCHGHHLESTCYLQKTPDVGAADAAAKRVVEQHLIMEEAQTDWKGECVGVWAEAFQTFKSSIEHWKSHGRGFWPQAELEAIEHQCWTDQIYTVRIT